MLHRNMLIQCNNLPIELNQSNKRAKKQTVLRAKDRNTRSSVDTAGEGDGDTTNSDGVGGKYCWGYRYTSGLGSSETEEGTT